jgi:glycerophosphoryl diester phosphodiesterase
VAAVIAVLLSLALAGQVSTGKQNIAHRGASSYAPEHTLASYRLALEQRADYVEQDLAVTRDGQLICLHDDTLERTTDVERVFPDRAARSSDGGTAGARWYANDFTRAELDRLDAGSWFGAGFAGERIPSWQQAVDLVRGKAGLYPELKSPPLYTARGVDMVKLFVSSVKANGLDRPESLARTPVIVQSFDEQTVRRLAADLPGVPRVLLFDSFPAGRLSDERLSEIAAFANGIGPARHLIEDDSTLVRRAHARRLTVTAYTFRARDAVGFDELRKEMSRFLFQLGIDALFTDNPDLFPREPR